MLPQAPFPEAAARQSGFRSPDACFIGRAMATTKDFVEMVPIASAMFGTVFLFADDVAIDRATEIGAQTVTPINVLRSFAFLREILLQDLPWYLKEHPEMPLLRSGFLKEHVDTMHEWCKFVQAHETRPSPVGCIFAGQETDEGLLRMQAGIELNGQKVDKMMETLKKVLEAKTSEGQKEAECERRPQIHSRIALPTTILSPTCRI